jgi:ring-1,2-phenylacetyl-CoA epoxidase subunit PaaE
MAFGLFKRKEKKPKTDNRYINLTIKKVVPVSKEAVNVIFEKPETGFDYKPGQFITLIDEVNGKKIRRAYSLCTSPLLGEDPAVTVKRVEGGQMSNHVNDTYQAGQQIEVMEAMGMFVTEYDASNEREVVMIGGGSGITPLYAIIKTMLNQEPKSKVTLIYANRAEETVIFKDELDQLGKENDRFTLVHVLEEKSDLAAFIGRPDETMVKEIVDKVGLSKTAEYFICGPQPMMDVFQSGLNQSGIEDSQIHIESFEAGKTSPADTEISSGSGNDAEVTIILNGESYSLTLDKSRPILEQALEKDLDLPYSCQSGLCTACRGKCMEGEVSVDKVMGLSDDELANDYVLACVGKPISDKIRLEIG